jgi:hypothetical protein
MGIKIIGTGLGRTGTHSLKIALEQLGFGKCYHMFELFKDPSRLRHFEEAEKTGNTDWDKLFDGFHSAVDYPVARYYKQLLKKYPDAKIIHTTRDADVWYESCVETIFWASKPDAKRIFNMMVRLPFNSVLRQRFPVLKYDGKLLDLEFGDIKNKAEVIKRFKQRNEEIVKLVPKEQLLVFNVKDGWGPLCNFLGVSVPSTPFPKSNTREEFMKQVKAIGSGLPL